MKADIIKAVVLITGIVLVLYCSRPKEQAEQKNIPVTKSAVVSSEALIARGKYLTTIGGCNDCHPGPGACMTLHLPLSRGDGAGLG